jgi:coenzyme F420-reducing hydrogenase beta subunit
MDLRLYYTKVREAVSKIESDFPVLVSKETTDGGKGGILTEVARNLAAKMLVDGVARLADALETEAYQKQQAELRRIAEQKATAAKVQVAVLSAEEFTTLRDLTPSKG